MESFVELMTNVTKAQFKLILTSLSNKQKRLIKEIIHNVLHGGVELSATDRAYIRRYRHFLRQFTRRQGEISKHINLFHYIFRLVRKQMQ